MRLRSVGAFSIVCAISGVLTACGNSSKSHSVSVDRPSSVSNASYMQSVKRNASSFGARGKQYGDQAMIVNYSGSGRGFIACTGDGSSADLSSQMSLDSRTIVEGRDERVFAETVYIATKPVTDSNSTKANYSVAFSTTSSGKFQDGITCHATRNLEHRLLSLR